MRKQEQADWGNNPTQIKKYTYFKSITDYLLIVIKNSNFEHPSGASFKEKLKAQQQWTVVLRR